MDDACFSFEADNPVSLVNSATMLLQIVDETCEAHGLLVNMNDGKTEFSIEMTGVGARKQFKRLWREDRKAHCISTKTGKTARVVARHKYVARYEPGHKIRETMPKPKQTVHSQRITNWLTLCSGIHVSLCTCVNNLLVPCVFRA